MSVIVSNVLAGSNAYQTPPESVGVNTQEAIHPGVISGFSVEAQASPNATVKVNAGTAIVRATPSGGSQRLFRVVLSASTNVTIAANSSGSTKYDLIYIKLPAATLQNPPASGDFTEAATILSERHNGSGEALTDTNGLVLAEVTVANGFTSITNSNINNKAIYALDGATEIQDTLTYASATTVTVKGNYTYLIPFGAYFMYYQSSWKYANVTGLSYSTSTQLTTITLWSGTDYSVANAAITQAFFSRALLPNHPFWFNYSPSVAGYGSMTVGSVSVTKAIAAVIGRTLESHVSFTCVPAGTAAAYIEVSTAVTGASTQDSHVFGNGRNDSSALEIHSFGTATNKVYYHRLSGNYPLAATTVDGHWFHAL